MSPSRRPEPPPHVPASAISAFIEPARLDELLKPWVPGAEDRAFVVRCLVGEGPAHHRGSNYVLLALLAKVLEGATLSAADQSAVPVPMRLNPHLAQKVEDDTYPLQLPLAPLHLLAQSDSRELAAMVDCLTDGPPQHAVANVVMVCLLQELLRRPGGP